MFSGNYMYNTDTNYAERMPLRMYLLSTVLFCLIFFHFINQYMTNGLSHHYHLGESTFILGGIRYDFELLFHFSMKFL